MASPRARYEPAARKVARKYGIPEGLFLSLIDHESGWNPTARSSAGAYGLTQLMPQYNSPADVNDPLRNLETGARELAGDYKTFGKWDLALAAYNAGPNAVKKYGGIPPYHETQAYVPAVLAGAKQYGATPSSPEVALSVPGAPPLPPTAAVAAPGTPRQIDFTPYLLQNLGRPASLSGLAAFVQAQPQIAAPAPFKVNTLPARPGQAPPVQTLPARKGEVLLPANFKSTHDTSGLAGYPAIDVMMKPGTVAGAPEGGTIIRLSGHDPSGHATPGGPYGLSVYLRGNDGVTYFMTHFGTVNVRAGQKVRRGDPLGTAVDWEAASGGVTPSHIHIGRHG